MTEKFLTSCVDNKSGEVTFGRCQIHSLDSTHVDCAVTDLYIIQHQGSVTGQVDSTIIKTFVDHFSSSTIVHSSYPRPFSFYCSAGLRGAVRPI